MSVSSLEGTGVFAQDPPGWVALTGIAGEPCAASDGDVPPAAFFLMMNVLGYISTFKSPVSC